MLIGIMALQGAFIEHANRLTELGIASFEIRQKKDLEREMDGIILPGGESTTIYKLLVDLDMNQLLKRKIEEGLFVFGTCAGLLLLAKEVHNHDEVFLKTMNIVARKNAYGRQLGSFRTRGSFADHDDLELVFIRAPYIEEVGKDVEVLSIHEGLIVAAKQDNMLATSFHPELSKDTRIHEYFINMIKGNI